MVNKQLILEHVRSIPNFPKEGVVLRDLTTCISNPLCYDEVIDAFIIHMRDNNICPQSVVSIEAKGFIYGTMLAYELQLPIITIRKQGKLPGETDFIEYDTEYSHDRIEVDIDVLKKFKNAIFVDDVLATGGTALAVKELLKRYGVDVIYNFFVIELKDLEGVSLIKNRYSILEF